MRTLAFDYMDAFRNQKNLKLEGTGGKEGDGIYYWHPTEDSLKRHKRHYAIHLIWNEKSTESHGFGAFRLERLFR